MTNLVGQIMGWQRCPLTHAKCLAASADVAKVTKEGAMDGRTTRAEQRPETPAAVASELQTRQNQSQGSLDDVNTVSVIPEDSGRC